MKYKILLFISLLILSCQKKNDEKIRLSGTTAIFNDTLLICSTLKDSVIVENIKNKKIIFSKKINDTEAIRPQPILDKNNRLYSVFSENELSCIDIKTNALKWTYTTDQKINVIKAVNDSLIVIGIRAFGLTVLNSQTRKPLYHLEESHSSLCNSSFIIQFTFDKEKIYISDFQCHTVAAFDLKNGKKLWSYKSAFAGTSKVKAYNNFIFCGITGNPQKNEGKIVVLDKNNGSVLTEENQAFDLMTDPIIYQNKILYYTYNGELKEFDPKELKSKTLYKFNKENAICSTQLHLIQNDLYLEECQLNIIKFNLETKTIKKITEKKKGLNAVYLYNNEVKFVY